MSKIPCAPTFFGGQKILVSLRWPPPLQPCVSGSSSAYPLNQRLRGMMKNHGFHETCSCLTTPQTYRYGVRVANCTIPVQNPNVKQRGLCCPPIWAISTLPTSSALQMSARGLHHPSPSPLSIQAWRVLAAHASKWAAGDIIGPDNLDKQEEISDRVVWWRQRLY
jgi:hypothetical protein